MIKIYAFVMVLSLFFGYSILVSNTILHESLHEKAFNTYGCLNVTIEYDAFGLTGKTIPHCYTTNYVEVARLNYINDVVGYHAFAIIETLYVMFVLYLVIKIGNEYKRKWYGRRIY